MIKIIISAVILLIAGAVFFLSTEPMYGDVKKIHEEIDRSDLALDKARKLKERQDILLQTYNDFDKASIDRLEKLLPNHVDNVRLILDLDRLAGMFGMAVQNVVISRSANESSGKADIGSIESGNQKSDSLVLKFSTRGTYANFMAFLSSLEASLRIVDVVSLSLSPEGKSDSAGQTALSETASAGGASKGASSQAEARENIYKYEISIRTYWLK